MLRGTLIGIVMLLGAGLALAQPARSPAIAPPPNLALLDRLERMSPEQRQRALDRLPPLRRERIEARLRWYRNLTPEERNRVRRQFEWFRQLPPEKQDAVRQLSRRLNQLPENRRRAVRRGVRELQMLEEPRRQFRLSRPWFRNRYSPEELEMVQELLEVLPPPRATAPNIPPC
jgi:hypothetical protein